MNGKHKKWLYNKKVSLVLITQFQHAHFFNQFHNNWFPFLYKMLLLLLSYNVVGLAYMLSGNFFKGDVISRIAVMLLGDYSIQDFRNIIQWTFLFYSSCPFIVSINPIISSSVTLKTGGPITWPRSDEIYNDYHTADAHYI